MPAHTHNQPPRLAVHPDGFLVTEEDRPFFYLADTVWMAFANLTVDEWERYLAHRRLQGFNALQISILPVTHDTSIRNASIQRRRVVSGCQTIKLKES